MDKRDKRLLKEIKNRKRRTKEKVSKPSINDENIQKLALSLVQKNKKEINDQKFFSTKNILNMIGAGILSLTEMYPHNIIRRGKPYLQDPEVFGSWKRFNIPYLKRTLKRLEKSKVIEIKVEKGKQVIKITDKGRTKILRNTINDIKIEKPGFWNGKWWLVSYDLPEDMHNLRDGIRKYLLSLGFFPIQKSVYVHAYPCKEQMEFLREYYGIREYMTIFKIEWIENDGVLKEFFNLK
ncbi:hypothetical protein A2954_07715 [Candidatus Roizmanbacteria bacterium RIFCSPLOWO2_01_FULL_37_12]|uniref:Transcriptional repressor PaaX-like central Cas2-like domain-containing protein n=1 Tax=Candidatus Roizmanbacteria bacterium RIFCSPLOWO2_01_FULL_37_12 TaxID=1802056 RepID=A0A1F7I848_9BACT|nr:MAG: hypothetical protein A3D76_00140 [Candidatus Roizmanbacteria bacterium RIFCSPHIGHO2_02_FULL_37_9b]OGK39540.1 MAG: hypothetical protein A2954_07715 [Candidatus Roizmanbacteria bacterium RIFCSPLOWO2_01_FULL_37_12]